MNALECFGLYMALKLHFTQPKFDFFKYNGTVKQANLKTFEKRKDQYFFKRLCKLTDVKGRIVSGMVHNNRCWIKDILEDETIYMDWKKRNQSITYTFQQDLSQLDRKLADVMKVENGEHPQLLKRYLDGSVSIETVVIILDLTKTSFAYWSQNLTDTLWKKTSFLLLKYKPFVHYEKTKMSKIMLDYFH